MDNLSHFETDLWLAANYVCGRAHFLPEAARYSVIMERAATVPGGRQCLISE